MKLASLPQHHAILLTSSRRDACGLELFEELKEKSPAHRFFNQTVLDIDTAREIISWANTPYNEEKIALISFHTAGVPAQNALLKVLEEPRVGVKFILLTSNKENIIPTVLSRVQHVQSAVKTSLHTDDALQFLKTKHTERMKLPVVVTLLTKVDEEKRKDREGVRSFILSVADALAQTKNDSRYILETLEIASYSADPSASGKALLEYLALLLPISLPQTK